MPKSCPKCDNEIDSESATRCPFCNFNLELLQNPAKIKIFDDREIELEEKGSFKNIFKFLLQPKPRVDNAELSGRIGLYLIFLIWGAYFIFIDWQSEELASSFMHNINLVFHEAGHVLFRLFGEFMTVLGGSLFQLIIPFVIFFTLAFQNFDNLGASIGLWWFGQSLLDLSPYIGDARALQLMLITGGTGADMPGTHDWEFILKETGLIKKDLVIANIAQLSGKGLIILSLIWGAYLLLQEHKATKAKN